ncbi:MAG: hypothetical protein GXO75_06415, partial [Calditrichaeota bacterium]|nr:hypothetical protein [Calditrichota bacterium]
KLCTKSVRASNVKTYLNRFGAFDEPLQMAVIIQKMLQPEIAGVIFTINPLTNNSESLLLEIIEGSGEKLVSGDAEPMRFKVDRSTKQLSPLAGSQSNGEFPAKYGTLIDQLIARALEIENHFGEAQDIEWAISRNKLWILQSRPVTRDKADIGLKSDSSGRIWTHYFFAERFSQPLSPLGWSVLKKAIEKSAFAEPLWYLGEERIVKKKAITRLFSGRPFTGLDVFHKLYKIIPLRFISRDKRDALMLHNRGSLAISAYFKTGWYLLTRMVLRDFNWIPLINLRNWYHFLARCEKKLEISAKNDFQSLQAAQKKFIEYEELTGEFLALHRWSITFADIFYVILKQFLKILGDSDAENTVRDLLAGLPGNLTVETNLQLEKVSKTLENNDQFRKSISGFLQKFGHRSESLDIKNAPWGDNPQLVLNFAKQLSNEKAKSFEAIYRKNVRSRIEAEALCRDLAASKNHFPKLAYFIFKKILKYSREFTLLRENQRDLWQRILYKMRHVVLFTGKTFFQNGCLKEIDDIFYLNRKEFLALSSDCKSNSTFKAIVERRRLAGRYQPGYDSELKVSEGASLRHINSAELEGLGVSKGVVRGKARVARTFLEASAVQHNEILISHSADPAWTPIYGVIGGLVLEVGGILSHASIIAREFGLPTVTSVKGATEVIKSGDLIQIDGMEGKVDILQRSEDHH